MRDQIRQALDSDQELQTLINSPEWAQDTVGALASQAVRLCIAAEASEGEAYEYLEVD